MGALALGSYEFSFLPNQMIHQQSTLGLEMVKPFFFFRPSRTVRWSNKVCWKSPWVWLTFPSYKAPWIVFQASHVWAHLDLRVVILFLVLWGSLGEDRLWVKAQDYCHRRSTLDDDDCQDNGRIPHPDVCKSKIIQNHIKNGFAHQE